MGLVTTDRIGRGEVKSPAGYRRSGSLSFVAIMVLVLIFGAQFALAGSPDQAREMVGKPSPEFGFNDLDGVRHDFRNGSWGRFGAVVVNFWGLRCGACLQEMPFLDAIYRKYRPEGLFVVGSNVDGADAATIREKMKQMKLSVDYRIAEDPELKILDLFHMTGAPLTFVIDSKGVVRFLHEGFEEGDEKELEKVIEKVLKDR